MSVDPKDIEAAYVEARNDDAGKNHGEEWIESRAQFHLDKLKKEPDWLKAYVRARNDEAKGLGKEEGRYRRTQFYLDELKEERKEQLHLDELKQHPYWPKAYAQARNEDEGIGRGENFINIRAQQYVEKQIEQEQIEQVKREQDQWHREILEAYEQEQREQVKKNIRKGWSPWKGGRGYKTQTTGTKRRNTKRRNTKRRSTKRRR